MKGRGPGRGEGMQRGFEDRRMKGRGPCKREGAARRRKSGGGNAKVTVTPGRAWSGRRCRW
ncbi:hypothetical protein dqs_0895 [Azoarcus olearius]|nr:hypothetical protein dqs_0895 [Azoarcus olearius]